jgi:hypothetical protein
MKTKAKKTKKRQSRDEPAAEPTGPVNDGMVIKPLRPTRQAGDNLRRRAEWFRRRTAGTSK